MAVLPTTEFAPKNSKIESSLSSLFSYPLCEWITSMYIYDFLKSVYD